MLHIINSIIKGRCSMFNVGDIIVYGNSGVFCVSEYCHSPVDKKDDRIFYLLRPLHESPSNIIITPADNDRIMMRPIISENDAYELIDKIPYISTLTIENEKYRKETYRESIAKCCLEEYVKIIKTVHQRREDVLRHKKRLSETDADYEKRAKYCLYSEIASVFNIELSHVEDFINQRIAQNV